MLITKYQTCAIKHGTLTLYRYIAVLCHIVTTRTRHSSSWYGLSLHWPSMAWIRPGPTCNRPGTTTNYPNIVRYPCIVEYRPIFFHIAKYWLNYGPLYGHGASFGSDPITTRSRSGLGAYWTALLRTQTKVGGPYCVFWNMVRTHAFYGPPREGYK